jgi:DNA-binding beta-propeller fold protein YncE
MGLLIVVHAVAALLIGPGGQPTPVFTTARTSRPAAAPPADSRPRASRPVALVTDEAQNLLAVVDLGSRTARDFIGIPGGPQYVAAEPGIALVTSPGTGTVTVLTGHPFRVVKVLSGFATPRVIEMAPGGRYAFVTDDARGTLDVVDVVRRRVLGSVWVGARAHHIGVSPDARRVWIALSERARTIVVVDTAQPARPRVIARFDPGFAAHDVAFSPDGASVWISSAAGPDVLVVRASDRTPLFTIPVGPPPQHIAFAGPVTYLTSGYGSAIEEVATRSGQILHRAHTPYGSFEPAAAGGYVTTTSLLDGETAIFTPELRLLRVVPIGPATRDVELSAW